MDYSFATGVSACLADGRLVILNVPADRYLMMPTDVEAALLRLIENRPAAPGDEAVYERLCTGGLVLQRSPRRELELCTGVTPVRSLLDDGWRPPGAGRIVGAAMCALGAASGLKILGLERTLDRLTAVPAPSKDNSDRAIAMAAAFAELRYSVSALDRCLPLSVALAFAAKQRHGAVQLVLGVRCHPFGAHAWIQLDGTVLNDRLDMVRSFTPILIL